MLHFGAKNIPCSIYLVTFLVLVRTYPKDIRMKVEDGILPLDGVKLLVVE